ncbi:DUF4032 domain-containing protein, partial [Streptomyces sp. NPDC056159]|uniref:DUF4032 domain-containing protein n=1 Tax=Streptomyces sp. NPDC056159 TaxID=3155537 RepID=UPI003442D12C
VRSTPSTARTAPKALTVRVKDTARPHRWVREVFRPTVRAVPGELRGTMDPAELYHELLEHRWYLSERAQHDIGLDTAVQDYVRNVLPGARRAPDTTPG